jgi:hydrogenase nickel incorporation protein HypA/HybF
MHELSIALSLLELVEEESARRACRVAAVHVRLGTLSGVVPTALTSAFAMAREGTALAELALLIEEVPVVVSCPACDAQRAPLSPWDLRCPACGGPTPDVVEGRELEIVALEIES